MPKTTTSFLAPSTGAPLTGARPCTARTEGPRHEACQPIADSAGAPSTGGPDGAGALTVLELRVRNHPGTMSHITGLFARRAFNLEAILCVPEVGRATSRVLLLVTDDPKLDQIERQLAKLHDVLEVRHRPEVAAEYFQRLRW